MTFFAPDRYETPRFVLRCYKPGDGVLLQDAHVTSIEHLKRFVGGVNPDLTVTQAEERVRKANADYLTNKDFQIGVFSLDESRLLGVTGFHLWLGPRESGIAEIGLWIRADAAGQGLGLAVLNATIAWGFTEWEWHRLVWRAATRNHASCRTAEKAGMTLEGIHRQMLPNVERGGKEDTAYYTILKEEWLRANGKSQIANYD